MVREWRQAGATERIDERVSPVGSTAPPALASAAVSSFRGAALGAASRVWAAERGGIHWSGTVDLVGGFPGAALWGGRAGAVELQLTDHFMLIEEARPYGFGLPIGWMTAAHALSGAEPVTIAPNGWVRVRYADGEHVRGFAVRARGGRFGIGAAKRNGGLIAALLACGLATESAEDAATTLPPDADLSIGWDEINAVDDERVVWSGNVTGPIAGCYDRAPVDIWLTTTSLIWGSERDAGVMRVPLSHIHAITEADVPGKTPAPALSIAVKVGDTGRIDLPFIFDRGTLAERNIHERGACLVALRARQLPVVATELPPQPWRPAPPELATLAELPQARHDDDDRRQASAIPRLDRMTPVSGIPERLAALKPTDLPKVPAAVVLDEVDLVEPVSNALTRLPWRRPTVAYGDDSPDAAEKPIWPPAVPAGISRQAGAAIAMTVSPLYSTQPRGSTDTPPGGDEPISHLGPKRSVQLEAMGGEPGVERGVVLPFPRLTAISVAMDFDVEPAHDTAPETVAAVDIDQHCAVPVLEPTVAQSDLPGASSNHHPTMASAPTEPLPLPFDGRQPVEPDACQRDLDMHDIAVARELAIVLGMVDVRLNGTEPDAPVHESYAASSSYDAAIVAIADAIAAGQLTEDDGRIRRERLGTVREATVRLWTLLDLFAAGYLDAEDVRRKRDALSSNL